MTWYVQAETLAHEVGVVPTVPRVVQCQRGRENVEHSSVEEYYRRITTLPLLDHLIQQMQERFGGTQIIASKLLKLIPSVIHSTSSGQSLDEAVEFYYNDLPSPAVVDTELSRWRTKWLEQSIEDCPSTLVSALQMSDKDFSLMLMLYCALHVPYLSHHVRMSRQTARLRKSKLLCAAQWGGRGYQC